MKFFKTNIKVPKPWFTSRVTRGEFELVLFNTQNQIIVKLVKKDEELISISLAGHTYIFEDAIAVIEEYAPADCANAFSAPPSYTFRGWSGIELGVPFFVGQGNTVALTQLTCGSYQASYNINFGPRICVTTYDPQCALDALEVAMKGCDV